MAKCHCKRCDYTWISRKENEDPIECPNCKTRDWKEGEE